MLDFNVSPENKTLQTEDGSSSEFQFYQIENIDLDEENISSFFAECDKKNCNLLAWTIKTTDILTEEDEIYNESYLANLRKLLKAAEDYSVKIVLNPLYENIPFENVTAAMKHTARRLKFCKSLVGFMFHADGEFKEKKVRQYFADELLQKHEQYKFFIV